MKNLLIIIVIIMSTNLVFSQSGWKRKEAVEPPMQLFQSTDVFDLPTAETLQKGDIYFSLTHKFVTPVSEGVNELFGFDGSVVMRIALGYAFTDDLLMKLGRSNYQGNYDLSFKYKTLEIKSDDFPIIVTLNAGISYNSKSSPEPEQTSKLYQYYGNLIINSMIYDKIGIGLLPSILVNSNPYYPENINSIVLGAYLQYSFSNSLSVFAEAYPTLNGWRHNYDGYNLGVDLNTGGHFFKFVIGNNIYTNPNGVMTGAADKFESGDLHIGFMIIRNL